MNLNIRTTDDGTDWVFLGHYRVARVEPDLPHHLLTELRAHEGDMAERLKAARREAYDQGVEDGYASGRDDHDQGVEDGYDKGYDKGWDDGYSSGRNE